MNDIKELWQYKELLYFFHLTGFKVPYKQTFIGIFWAIYPTFLTTMFVFNVFFGALAKVPSDSVPYPIFVYTAFFFGNFFQHLGETSTVLISKQSIVTKVYSPRLILPISSVATKFVILWLRRG